MTTLARVLVRRYLTQYIRKSAVHTQLKHLGRSLEHGKQWNVQNYSNYPKTASNYERSGYTRRFNQEEEEEDEYDVEDDATQDQLRKEHRASGSKEHVALEKSFSDFPLNEKLLQQLTNLGYDSPFEIQVVTLEHTLANRDVIARALTGSGKTLAFSIPIVHKLLERGDRRSNRSPKAIVISPTRELALQIYRSIKELDSRVKCVAVYGGASITKQEQEMRRGVDVICATPGRLNDLLQRGVIDLDELEFLCLDEADELLRPGFKEQIEDILKSPSKKQVMLFSATMPPEIKGITRQYMNDPVQIDITKNQKYKAPESVRHLCMRVPNNQQLLVVKNLIDEHKPERCIVFMETKRKAGDGALYMRKTLNLRAEGIHSDLSQARRENIMAAFRAGKVEVLVATDVAARGLDIPEVDLVIQVAPPRNGVDYYIHRSGRTGRAGREGLSVLLHSGHPGDWSVIREIERLAKLEHTEPPRFEAIIQDSAKETLGKLQKRTHSKLTESLLPLVEELDISGDNGQRLLASALASIVKGGDQGAEATSSGGGARYQKPSYQRNSYSGNDRYGGNRYGGDRYGGGNNNYANKRNINRGLGSEDFEDRSYSRRDSPTKKQSFYDYDEYD